MSITHPPTYIQVNSVEAAIEQLSNEDNTCVLAGGYSLVPLLKDGVETPDRLIDISAIKALSGISHDSGRVHISALTTHDRIATSPVVRENARALADATDSVGDFQARHQGTIAGNLVVAGPKYDAPAAVLALDGTVIARGPNGKRTIEIDEWFRESGENTLNTDELITGITMPKTDRSGYIRTSEYSGYAIVGVAATLDIEEGVIESPRIAVNGAKSHPIRLANVEELLTGRTPDNNLITQAGEVALDDVDPETLLTNDAATGAYRSRLIRSYCKEAIARAVTGS